MIVNMQDIHTEKGERIYIKYVGRVVLKVDSITMGTSSNKNQQIKVHMVDKAGHFITDTFVLTPNSLWALKLFAEALEVPTDIVNTDHFIGRYVNATIKDKMSNNNNKIFEIKKYEETKANKPFEVPQIEVTFENIETQRRIEALKQKTIIDEDEIPF